MHSIEKGIIFVDQDGNIWTVKEIDEKSRTCIAESKSKDDKRRQKKTFSLSRILFFLSN